jgi:hypothetical protein
MHLYYLLPAVLIIPYLLHSITLITKNTGKAIQLLITKNLKGATILFWGSLPGKKMQIIYLIG